MDKVRGTRKSRGNTPRLEKETHNISTTALVAESAKYYEGAYFDVDRSITAKQHMRTIEGKTLLRRGNPFDKPSYLRVDGKMIKNGGE